MCVCVYFLVLPWHLSTCSVACGWLYIAALYLPRPIRTEILNPKISFWWVFGGQQQYEQPKLPLALSHPHGQPCYLDWVPRLWFFQRVLQACTMAASQLLSWRKFHWVPISGMAVVVSTRSRLFPCLPCLSTTLEDNMGAFQVIENHCSHSMGKGSAQVNEIPL